MPIIDLITPIIDKVLSFIPNPIEREKVRAEQLSELLKILAQADQAQAEINRVEASNEHWFVSAWRPGCAWVCVAAFAWTYVIEPILCFLLTTFGAQCPITPKLDMAAMMPVLTGMLGLAGLRSWDKYNNTK